MFTENERKSISEKGSLAPTCCQNLGDLLKKMYFSVLFHILGVFFTYQDVLEIKYEKGNDKASECCQQRRIMTSGGLREAN